MAEAIGRARADGPRDVFFGVAHRGLDLVVARDERGDRGGQRAPRAVVVARLHARARKAREALFRSEI